MLFIIKSIRLLKFYDFRVPARMSFSSNSKPIDDVIDDDVSMSILPPEVLNVLKNYFLSNISANDMYDEFAKESEPDFDLIEAVCDAENTIKRILSALSNIFSLFI